MRTILPADQLLHLLGVSCSLNGYLRQDVANFPEIICGEHDIGRANILFETMHLGRSRNGDDPRLLCQQPGKRDLGRRCLLARRDLADQLN
jgi:hypothetical protein